MTAAARTARWRARRTAGTRVLPIEITDDLVDYLEVEGLLPAWDRDDRDAITTAVKKMHDLLVWGARENGKI